MKAVFPLPIFVLSFFLGFYCPAKAGDLADGCIEATKAFLFRDKVDIVASQEFPNLSPPRSRIRLGGLMEMTYRCSFKSASKPLRLVEFCTDISCFKAGDQRFDEAAELLRRQGF